MAWKKTAPPGAAGWQKTLAPLLSRQQGSSAQTNENVGRKGSD